jgi:hypothetical protein
MRVKSSKKGLKTRKGTENKGCKQDFERKT